MTSLHLFDNATYNMTHFFGVFNTFKAPSC